MDGRARGIDVSHLNGVVDWGQAAAAGVQFAFAKASQGVDSTRPCYTDSQFATNWQAMKDNGIVRGAYHFIGLPLPGTPTANWDNDLHGQIDHFLETVGPLCPGDLPPVLDLEDGDCCERWQALIKSDRSAAIGVVRELIDYTTQQLNGVLPILYTGSFWTCELCDPDAATMPYASYPLWISQYPQVHTPVAIPGQPGQTDCGEAGSFAEYAETLDGHCPRHMPAVWGGTAKPAWTFWQFSGFGHVPGVCTGIVDLDVFNGSLDEMASLCVPGSPPVAN